ncbi:MAG: hypothetical protein WCK15_15440 [Pirellula sp.]
MATCRLTVEIDEPSRPRIAGEPITGFVVVQSDKDARCKGLVVTCYWSTHGRGNTARGDVETATLFDGEWQQGKEYRYPFKLATATWPPTYYGNMINVSHYVQAQAQMPWAKDTKTLQEFSLIATDSPPDLAPTSNVLVTRSGIGWIFAPILLLILLLFIPFVLFLLPIFGIIAASYWIIRVLIPSQITGKVEFKTEPAALSQGQTLTGSCEFTPKRASTINGITWTVKCNEKCVSGSGSNRSTHTHEVLTKVQPLAEAGVLEAGKLQKFEFSYVIPTTVPPSLKFTDNEISWSSEFRIDIPKWPDWIKEIPFVVKPASKADLSKHESGALSAATTDATPEDDQWLTEVYQQVVQSAKNPDRLKNVIEAVQTQVFAISVDIQGEVEEPLESDIDEDGIWVSAMDSVRNVRLVAFVPQSLVWEGMLWTNGWQGNANVIGFEDDTGRIILKLC